MVDVKKDFICVLPWNHVFVANDGNQFPCCLSQNNGSELNLQDMRNDMLAGKVPKPCSHCWQMEKVQKPSYRNHVNTLFSHTYKKIQEERVKDNLDVEFIDFRFGNICNLKCRMCSPKSSSTLNVEFKEYYGNSFQAEPQINNINQLDKLIENKSITRINIAGGEPFYIKEVYQFLKKLSATDMAKSITLTMHTNLTTDEFKIVETFSHFRDVEIGVSIDGFRALNDYIRHPSQWNKIISNIQYIRNHASVHVNSTIQVYNIFSFDQLFRFFESEQGIKAVINILEYPKHLSIQCLPAELKILATERLQRLAADFPDRGDINSLIEHMNSQHTTENFSEFIRWTRYLDLTRNQSVLNYVPELKGYLDKNDYTEKTANNA